MRRLGVALAVVLALTAPAGAQRVILRFATDAPDGTAWARLFRAMARDIQDESQGRVGSKWYFGGIAGDEMEMLSRLQRGQLDVVMSGGMLCMKLSPSMRVLRLLGLFQSRDESAYVLGRLRPTIDAEFAEHGMHHMCSAGLGPDMVYSRRPVRTLAELRATRIWVWSLDETMRAELEALGVPDVPLPVDEAARAFDQGRIDGFISVPSAALAFQWSAQARYLNGLRVAYLPGCMVMTNSAYDQLSVDERQALTAATARFQARLEQLGRSQDDALLGGLFARQGVTILQPSATYAADFFEAAARARDKLRDQLGAGLIERVTGWLADYRAEHDRPKN